MPKLSRVIREQDKEILEATRSQYKVLSLLHRQKRALISGPAGSGKTFLALEKARRIVEKHSSKRVLLVCFNIRLSRHLSKLTSGLPQVDVFYFHQLCLAFCRKAGIKLMPADKAKSIEDYYLFDLPEGFMKALDVVAERYDALIVDEGQDFDSTWWIPL
jgi:superfamily I DNA and RNA helicase